MYICYMVNVKECDLYLFINFAHRSCELTMNGTANACKHTFCRAHCKGARFAKIRDFLPSTWSPISVVRVRFRVSIDTHRIHGMNRKDITCFITACLRECMRAIVV